ncbi:hypothetical protein A2954_03955 [Candidatus Roizmanbacteria bacterium RIFCSPLOWO2_01_FULL_37_12]|uniref:Uncharacterized protein n=1 Tax=Candidatus Roizmanbacteria bacterium RIFCSPLOWO2_01_FULL_37_12 TaxID=1802056 RepID=A0A1F7IEP4_9BACT|nr:MAG: hypothetical protein A3D76_03200 [Candidatus Roizmanbacteria bacterium RIFCSPHIGHO2_02_FULL_37_9b]OGK41839.1 MAG: hypothetical protein A2954_03955 [Candidatus Roizmanbacteria bacterium RIFCSPLOWO2_01_FULL_37_12]
MFLLQKDNFEGKFFDTYRNFYNCYRNNTQLSSKISFSFFAGRYFNSERKLYFLFSNRNFHYHQHSSNNRLKSF